MKNSNLFNTEKNRKATANEVAKYLIYDRAVNVIIGEMWGTEEFTKEEVDEVVVHYEKHLKSLRKKLNISHIKPKL
jgi:F0F1-type ATP synthase gamma subunit